MRSLIVMAMFAATFSHAAWNEYTEDRNLELAAAGVEKLEIDVGAGSLEVIGESGRQDIVVRATIRVDDDEDDARATIESDMRLSLEKENSVALLYAYFDRGMWGSGTDTSIDLQVRVPTGIGLTVDDGSGSIRIESADSDVYIDDGSGSIAVMGAASVVIDDGSGSIRIDDVTGDVEIEDGSGDINVQGVGGSVTIDDGSGSINVDDVEQNLTIVDDGSGSVRLADIRGRVSQPHD